MQYWMLCHNCDAWHLPSVCQTVLHKCVQCNSYGHLEYFCPVKPAPRERSDTSVLLTGIKRQRTNGSDASEMSRDSLTPNAGAWFESV